MSRRIAHRPRYHSMRSKPQSPLRSHKDFFLNRWTYRCRTVSFQKRTLGEGLLLIPWGYRVLRGAIGS
jgi:hypothetical protein